LDSDVFAPFDFTYGYPFNSGYLAMDEDDTAEELPDISYGSGRDFDNEPSDCIWGGGIIPLSEAQECGNCVIAAITTLISALLTANDYRLDGRSNNNYKLSPQDQPYYMSLQTMMNCPEGSDNIKVDQFGRPAIMAGGTKRLAGPAAYCNNSYDYNNQIFYNNGVNNLGSLLHDFETQEAYNSGDIRNQLLLDLFIEGEKTDKVIADLAYANEVGTVRTPNAFDINEEQLLNLECPSKLNFKSSSRDSGREGDGAITRCGGGWGHIYLSQFKSSDIDGEDFSFIPLRTHVPAIRVAPHDVADTAEIIYPSTYCKSLVGDGCKGVGSRAGGCDEGENQAIQRCSEQHFWKCKANSDVGSDYLFEDVDGDPLTKLEEGCEPTNITDNVYKHLKIDEQIVYNYEDLSDG